MTREEEKIYDGEKGWAYQTSMRILVRLGDLLGATQLIPIKSAHISGVSYRTLGDAPIEFLENLAKSGATARVTSTINPAGLDFDRLSEIPISREVQEKQLKIVDLYVDMGIKPVLTCTPYYIKTPIPGSHLAWAESSAVIYANSILGARTNREGGPSALASALIGKTPNYGIHRKENRRPQILIELETQPRNESDYGTLGLYIGREVKDEVPLISGLSQYSETDMKQLCAAMGASGMTSIFHVCQTCSKQEKKMETISVSEEEMDRTSQSLSTTSDEPDMVLIGCPHCSLDEIRQICGLLSNKKIKENFRFWVCASRHIRAIAGEYVTIIEKVGGKVLSNTCAIVSWLKELGVETLMTNSAKTAFYAPTMNNVEVRFASLEKCIEAACTQ